MRSRLHDAQSPDPHGSCDVHGPARGAGRSRSKERHRRHRGRLRMRDRLPAASVACAPQHGRFGPHYLCCQPVQSYGARPAAGIHRCRPSGHPPCAGVAAHADEPSTTQQPARPCLFPVTRPLRLGNAPTRPYAERATARSARCAQLDAWRPDGDFAGSGRNNLLGANADRFRYQCFRPRSGAARDTDRAGARLLCRS